MLWTFNGSECAEKRSSTFFRDASGNFISPFSMFSTNAYEIVNEYVIILIEACQSVHTSMSPECVGQRSITLKSITSLVMLRCCMSLAIKLRLLPVVEQEYCGYCVNSTTRFTPSASSSSIVCSDSTHDACTVMGKNTLTSQWGGVSEGNVGLVRACQRVVKLWRMHSTFREQQTDQSLG